MTHAAPNSHVPDGASQHHKTAAKFHSNVTCKWNIRARDGCRRVRQGAAHTSEQNHCGNGHRDPPYRYGTTRHVRSAQSKPCHESQHSHTSWMVQDPCPLHAEGHRAVATASKDSTKTIRRSMIMTARLRGRSLLILRRFSCDLTSTAVKLLRSRFDRHDQLRVAQTFSSLTT